MLSSTERGAKWKAALRSYPRGAYASLAIQTLFVAGAIYVMYASYSPAPYWDDWRLYVDDRRALSGWMTNNEHIINFTALGYLLDNELFGGQGFLQRLSILALLLGFAALIRGELRRPDSYAGACLAVVMVVSATQYTNLTWAFQLGFVGCFVLGAAAVWTLSRTTSLKPRAVLLSWLLAIAAATALSAGIILLGFLAAYVWVLPGRRYQKAAYSGAFALAFVYFTAQVPPGAMQLMNLSPESAIAFAAAVLGSLGGGVLDLRWIGIQVPGSVLVAASVLTSAAIVALWAGVLWRIARSGRLRRPTGRDMWPVGIGLWTLAVAVAIGFGRSALPITEAISSRYVTVSIVAILALMVAIERAAGVRARRLISAASASAIVVLALAQVSGMAQAEVGGRRLEVARAAMVNDAFDAEAMDTIRPQRISDAVRDVATFMQIRGISVYDDPAYRLIGHKLFDDPFVFAPEPCPVVIEAVDRSPLFTEVTVTDADAPFVPDLIAFADGEAIVQGVALPAKWMLGLTGEGRRTGHYTGFVVRPPGDALRVFQVSFSARRFCYATAW